MAEDPYRRVAGLYDKIFEPMKRGLRLLGTRMFRPKKKGLPAIIDEIFLRIEKEKVVGGGALALFLLIKV